MMFGPWDIPENEYLETCVRLERARKIDSAAVGSINEKCGTVLIMGSEGVPYMVSLSGCGCADFQRRSLPCKHMIRLALELGLPLDVPEFDPYLCASYNVEEDISRLTDRWHSGQLTIDALTKCVLALRSSASKAKRPRGRPKKK